MKTLLKKEFALALHPAAALFVLFAVMAFIPNYPYEVMFFFSGLGAFFICLTARENKDLQFTCVLPVPKHKIAAARVLFCACLQAAQVLLCVPVIAIKSAFIHVPNLAGMEANAAFLGIGLTMLGGFNAIFFPQHFQDPSKVGKPFLFGAAFDFIVVALNIALCQTVPLFRDVLDTPDPQHFGTKCIVLAIGALAYAGLTWVAVKKSEKAFVKSVLN